MEGVGILLLFVSSVSEPVFEPEPVPEPELEPEFESEFEPEPVPQKNSNQTKQIWHSA